jgi:hypothetical protein
MRSATLFMIWVGAAATLAALTYAGDLSKPIPFIGFTIWTLLPYYAFFILMRRPPIALSALIHVCVMLAIAFGLLGYYAVVFGRPDAQNGLVFLFVPLYQLAAAIMIIGVTIVIGKILRLGDGQE